MKKKYIKHQRDYNILASVIIMEAFFGKEMINLTYYEPLKMYLNIKDGVYFHLISEDDYLAWPINYYRNNSLSDFKKYNSELNIEYTKYERYIKKPTGSSLDQLKTIYRYLYLFTPIIMISALIPIYVKNPHKDWTTYCVKIKKQYDKVHRLLMTQQEKILNKIEKEKSIEKNILKYLTTNEFEEFLNTNKLPKDVKNRKNSLLVEFYKNSKIIISPEKEKILSKIDPQKKIKLKDNIIKGNIAHRGIVRGKVRIIKKIMEADNLKNDEVLVTSMTDPRYLLAMKKAGAIITDEGGITCHAAIVSREMKKPCIIGTKIATQVLKNGDLVEVDADNGIVKVIK